MKRLLILSIASIPLILAISCLEEKQNQAKIESVKEIKILIADSNFEAARLAAVDTLDSDIKTLYYEADKYLGHASHLDVRCNERIEEILYNIVKQVPARNIRLNRDIYGELLVLFPENELYKKKFIYYDRKARATIK